MTFYSSINNLKKTHDKQPCFINFLLTDLLEVRGNIFSHLSITEEQTPSDATLMLLPFRGILPPWSG